MTGPSPHRFGEIVLERGFITPEQLQEALSLQRGTDKRLGELLFEMGLLSQEQINWALSERLGIPYVEFGDEVVDLDLARSMPEELLRRHEAVPVLRVDDELTVILSDPTNRQAAVDLEALTGARVTTAMASRDKVLHLLDKAFPPIRGVHARSERPETQAPGSADVTGVAQVYALLLGAVREGATEVHLEPLRQEIRVRSRVAGRLCERARLPRALLGPVTFRFRVLAGLRGEPAPRQAHVRTQLEGRDLELDLLFYPTLHGEAVTVRFQRGGLEAPTLASLGLPLAAREALAGLVNGEGGLLFVTGWEPRARATLLYALAQATAGPTRKTLTVERAVSFVVPEFVQVELPHDFAGAAATILAHPSDVAVVEDLGTSPVCAAAFGSVEQGTLVLGGLGFATNAAALAHLMTLDVPKAPLLAVTRGVVHVRRRGEQYHVEALPLTEALRGEILSGTRWTSPSC